MNYNFHFKKYFQFGFLSFPKDEERQKLWALSLWRENFTVTNYSKICSKHFEPDCFDRERFGGTWLKKTAVPTIFDFPDHLQPKEKVNRSSSRKRDDDESQPLSEPGPSSMCLNFADYKLAWIKQTLCTELNFQIFYVDYSSLIANQIVCFIFIKKYLKLCNFQIRVVRKFASFFKRANVAIITHNLRLFLWPSF